MSRLFFGLEKWCSSPLQVLVAGVGRGEGGSVVWNKPEIQYPKNFTHASRAVKTSINNLMCGMRQQENYRYTLA